MHNVCEKLNFPVLYLGPKTDVQSKWSHSFPFQQSQGSKCYQVLSDMMRKMKGPIFVSDLQDDEKHLHFFPLTKFFQLPILSSWEAQDRSEDPIEKTQKTQKFTSAFVLRADRSKEFFWRQNRWVYLPFNSQVKQTCTLYFCWTQNKWTEPSVPLLSLYSHVGGTPVLKKEEVTGTNDLQLGHRDKISGAVFQTTCAE